VSFIRYQLAIATLVGLGTIAPAAARAQLAESPSENGGAQEPVTLRVLAYNIKHGEGMDGMILLERAARVINALDPDVVTLQEVDSAVNRTFLIDQARTLGELTGMRSVFGGFFDYQGGRYGMALLSKHPIVSWENHRLPDGAEPRTALAARIRVAGNDIIVVGIQLYATAEERYAQAAQIVEIYQNETAPVILAGDFNSRPDSEVIDLFRRYWQVPFKGSDHLTFPSEIPNREIDYIMYRPRDRFEITDSWVVYEPLVSDHRPVLLELRLLGAQN
jgi:endonuclease/exonuclease/phosphatase family metal-dependent hydrolase